VKKYLKLMMISQARKSPVDGSLHLLINAAVIILRQGLEGFVEELSIWQD